MVDATGLSGPPRVALRVLPMRDGEPSGDAAAHHVLPATADGPGGHLLVIVDGLGHGAPAAHAAEVALHTVALQPALPLPALFDRLDAALAATRGAAIGLARLEAGRLRYAGLGNTRALRWRGAQLSYLSSQYGIAGGGLPATLDQTELDLQPGDWLLLYTDGLAEMLQLAAHLPEWEREPMLLCEHLLARWRSGRDDAGVLVFHLPASAPVGAAPGARIA